MASDAPQGPQADAPLSKAQALRLLDRYPELPDVRAYVARSIDPADVQRMPFRTVVWSANEIEDTLSRADVLALSGGSAPRD